MRASTIPKEVESHRNPNTPSEPSATKSSGVRSMWRVFRALRATAAQFHSDQRLFRNLSASEIRLVDQYVIDNQRYHLGFLTATM